MKVIDEKGKLFGKLNIIDLLVIVFIIAAVVVVGMKFLGGGADEPVATTRLTYTVRVTAQPAKVAERVAEYVDTATGKRDQLLAGDDVVNGYITDYWIEETRYNRLNDGKVELFDPAGLESSGAELVDICFVIEANVIDTLTNKVGSQEVRIGKNHIVKTAHLEFSNGVVESCVWEPAV